MVLLVQIDSKCLPHLRSSKFYENRTVCAGNKCTETECWKSISSQKFKSKIIVTAHATKKLFQIEFPPKRCAVEALCTTSIKTLSVITRTVRLTDKKRVLDDHGHTSRNILTTLLRAIWALKNIYFRSCRTATNIGMRMYHSFSSNKNDFKHIYY